MSTVGTQQRSLLQFIKEEHTLYDLESKELKIKCIFQHTDCFPFKN